MKIPPNVPSIERPFEAYRIWLREFYRANIEAFNSQGVAEIINMKDISSISHFQVTIESFFQEWLLSAPDVSTEFRASIIETISRSVRDLLSDNTVTDIPNYEICRRMSILLQSSLSFLHFKVHKFFLGKIPFDENVKYDRSDRILRSASGISTMSPKQNGIQFGGIFTMKRQDSDHSERYYVKSYRGYPVVCNGKDIVGSEKALKDFGHSSRFCSDLSISRKLRVNNNVPTDETNLKVDSKEVYVYFAMSKLGIGPEVQIFVNEAIRNGLFIATKDLSSDNSEFTTIDQIEEGIEHNEIYPGLDYVHLTFFDIIIRIFFLMDFNSGNLGFVRCGDALFPKIIDFWISKEYSNAADLDSYREDLIYGYMHSSGMKKYGEKGLMAEHLKKKTTDDTKKARGADALKFFLSHSLKCQFESNRDYAMISKQFSDILDDAKIDTFQSLDPYTAVLEIPDIEQEKNGVDDYQKCVLENFEILFKYFFPPEVSQS